MRQDIIIDQRLVKPPQGSSFEPQFGILGAPEIELHRSLAAKRVGKLAKESGLLMCHYEYRVAMEPPEEWVPLNRPDLGSRSYWEQGVLPEHKYQSFRNDLMIGSFNPGHRAKWTTHELCHGLVGFAWQPGATPLFHALAARLSELLPVALFYFFDEVGLRRCADHKGPLFASYCEACEREAFQGPRAISESDEAQIQTGIDFIERELSAIHRSIKAGYPIASPWGNLDLCSDGLAYAAAQSTRLNSPIFSEFMERFHSKEQTGHHGSLASLMERTVQVSNYLIGRGEASPWQMSTLDWQCRDLAWRILEVREQVVGDAVTSLTRLVDDLTDNRDEATLKRVYNCYCRLYDDFHLPEPDNMFAVGYWLFDNVGYSHQQISDGLASACPITIEVLEKADTLDDVIQQFIGTEEIFRKPLGLRFAEWMSSRNDELAELVTFEALVTHTPPRNVVALSLGKGNGDYQLNPGVVLIPVSEDLLTRLGLPFDEGENVLLVTRDDDGTPKVIHPEPEVATYLLALKAGENPAVPANIDELIEAGLVSSKTWSMNA